jgi:hypothetical protein
MQPFTNYQNAVRAFNGAFDQNADAPGSIRPTEVERLRGEAYDKTQAFLAWVPETAEGAEVKLRNAAASIESGTFVTVGELSVCDLSGTATELATLVISGEHSPALASRLRRLIGDCEESIVACHRAHGYSDGADVIEILHTTLTGLTRLRVVE